MIRILLLLGFLAILLKGAERLTDDSDLWTPVVAVPRPGEVIERPHQPLKTIKLLKDPDNRVLPDFEVSPFFRPNVEFWFHMYTHFESSHVVIHDRNNLDLIYLVLDFTGFRTHLPPDVSPFRMQQKKAEERIRELRQSLNLLSEGVASGDAKQIVMAVERAGLKIPSTQSQRREFYLELRDGLRSQTGQSDYIREGLIRSIPYQAFIRDYLRSRSLPEELLAIPFLESSFNPRAHSKVAAMGVWQFMPLIGSYYMPRRTLQFDYRASVGVSSVAAGFLMAENKNIMKSWDLAVTAYNSGTKHLLKAKHRLRDPRASLEKIIRMSQSKHFGFASKNFYSEFLALVHVLAYQKEIYAGTTYQSLESLSLYLLKCPMRVDKTLSSDLILDLEDLNHHVKDWQKILPKALILTARSQLPEQKFWKVPHDMMRMKKPKEWKDGLRNQSCSVL